MSTQLANDKAESTVTNLTTYRPNVLTTLKNLFTSPKAAITLAEVFSPHFKDNRKIAFTLAEVLITLGIIGVVAAMTMPMLIQKHQDKVTVTKLKKMYSILSQSYLYAVQEYGTPDQWGFGYREADGATEEDPDKVASNAVIIRDKLFSHLKNLKKCDASSKREECGIASKYYYPNGTEEPDMDKKAGLSVVDGSSVFIMSTSPDCKQIRGQGKFLQNDCAWIYVDLNGKKTPNTWGRDLFAFYLTKYGIIPVGTPEEKDAPFSYPFEDERAVGRAAWVIMNENIDYLRCDDLSWNGKTKCK